MKRSELKRSSRRPEKRGPKREWSDAIEKVNTEGQCRYCGRVPSGQFGDRLEAAHTSGRKFDEPQGTERYVDPIDVVPLCTTHHLRLDAHQLDILSVLTWPEQGAVVKNRGMVGAWKHLTGEGK